LFSVSLEDINIECDGTSQEDNFSAGNGILTMLDDYCWPLGREVPDTSGGNPVEKYFKTQI
jgi:hypothetical protein